MQACARLASAWARSHERRLCKVDAERAFGRRRKEQLRELVNVLDLVPRLVSTLDRLADVLRRDADELIFDA